MSGYLDAAVLEAYPALGRFRARLGSRLIEVPQIKGCGRVFAKCEFDNPTATVKDRVACGMLWRVLQTDRPNQRQTRGLHVLEYSGGTLAVPLAQLCHELGIAITLVLSSGADQSLISLIEGYGAEVVLVDKTRGFYAVVQRASELSGQHPDWRFLCQHDNPANLYMHETTTGKEILDQLPVRRVDAWLTSVGTGGSLVGVYRALAQVHPRLALYATTPAEMPYGTSQVPSGKPKFAGSGGMGYGIRQPFMREYDDAVRQHVPYSFPETLAVMQSFHRETGIWIGSSAAANLSAARSLAAELGPDGVVVTMFPSAGTPEEQAKASAVTDAASITRALATRRIST
jgi:cysteine synthase A